MNKYNSWYTIVIGIIASAMIVLAVIIATQSYLWGLAALFATLAWFFIPGFDGSKDIWPKPRSPEKQAEIAVLKAEGVRVPIGFEAAMLFLGRPLWKMWIEEIDGEKIRRVSGPVVDTGYPWLFPGMSLRLVDTRLQVIPVKPTPVPAKDDIYVTIDSNASYYIRDVYQTLLVGGEVEIDESLDESTESAMREVALLNTSTDLRKNPECRKTIKERALKLVEKTEYKLGFDINDLYVGTVKLPQRIEDALLLKKENEEYVNARKPLEEAKISPDEIKEKMQYSSGISEPKKISENKVEIGPGLSTALNKGITALTGALTKDKKE